jgi:predicted permease
MLLVLNVTAPFFALVLCGYLAARYRLLPGDAVAALNSFVLYFALPCMMLRFTAGTPLHTLLNVRVFLTYGIAGLLVLVGVAAVVRLVGGEDMREAAFAGMAGSLSNWGYMGVALVPPLLGPAALAPLIAAGMADLLLVYSVALALASSGNCSGGGGARLGSAIRPIVRNPLLWGVVAGGALSAAGVRLPDAGDQFTRLLGQTAGPVALFTIGASLYWPGARIRRADVLAITGVKLFLHPVLAAAVAIGLFRLAGLEVRTVLLMAALPVGGTVFLFAERQGADAERIAVSILVSTALAFMTFSALCWALGVRASP